MLILTRQTKEIVMIGDDIQVIVLGVEGSTVALGFKAPRNISVHREEIYFRNHPFNFNRHKRKNYSYEFIDSKANERLRSNLSKLDLTEK